MKKLLNKKGITLVEVIVVIAIIAVLAAIIVPNISATSSFQQEAKESARAFFSNVQQVLIEEKFKGTRLSSNASATANDQYTLIYAVVDNSQSDADDIISIYIAYQNDAAQIEENWPGFRIKTFGSFDSDFQEINTEDSTDRFYEFGKTLKKLLSSNQQDCYYYAVIDSKYRVVSSYFSRSADYNVLNGKNFSKDERVKHNGVEYVVGAYPYNLCSQWQNIFRNPNEKHSSVGD